MQQDDESGPVLPVARRPADEDGERDSGRRSEPDEPERAHPAVDRGRERDDPAEDADRVRAQRRLRPPRRALATASQSRRSTSSSASTGATTSSLPTSSTRARSERAAARARRRAPAPFARRARNARAIPASAPPRAARSGSGCRTPPGAVRPRPRAGSRASPGRAARGRLRGGRARAPSARKTQRSTSAGATHEGRPPRRRGRGGPRPPCHAR